MAQETEMKLSVKQRQISKLKNHPLLQQGQLISSKQWLISRYLDTPHLDLKNQGLALRIRQKDDQFWLTVKNEGTTHQGLHQRQEWEYPVANDTQFDLSQLPNSLYSIIKPYSDKLQRLFTTEFKRTTWQISWQTTQIEAALDIGDIYIDQNWREPISEFELEIMDGSREGLLEFSQNLNNDLGLKPFNQSKAYRGYRLFYMAQQHA